MKIYLYNLIKFYYGSGSSRLRLRLNLMFFFKENGYLFLARLISINIEKKFSCYISPFSKIHKSVEFIHPVGIVIGKGVMIGKGCKIYQGVTFGGARKGDMELNCYPIVQDNSIIFAGAKVLGNIIIGEQSVIGANSVVIHNTLPKSTNVGIPSRMIRQNT